MSMMHSARISGSHTLSNTIRTINGFTEAGLVPGAVLAWQTDGGPISYHSVGTLDFGSTSPVDERTIFRIFSQSKPVTGIAALMLIEEGRLSLDQPLADILPAFSDMHVVIDGNVENTRPAVRPITIRHLLTHTAGFGMAGMTLSELYLQHGITPGDRDSLSGPGELPNPRSLPEFGERLAQLPLSSDPGTRFDYSVSLDVLGLVIETVAQIPFETFLQTRLFEPLGMIDTGFTLQPSQQARFMALREQQGDQFVLADDPLNSAYAALDYPSGGGGLLSTAHDYARFAAMLLNDGELEGVRILKPETVRLARSNLLPPAVTHIDVPLGETLSGAGMGAGMSVQGEAGKSTGGMFDWPGEVPKGVFGWPGAAGTACWMDPERRFFLLFLTQFWPSWINGSMRPQVIAAAYQDLSAAMLSE